MRKLALSGFAALAVSIMSPAAAWAWSSEPVAPKSADGANFAETEDPLKALQEKVDAKSGHNSSQSGFYFSSGVTRQPFGLYGFGSSQSDGAPFGYPLTPGFRR
jgi:hypothetical protein